MRAKDIHRREGNATDRVVARSQEFRIDANAVAAQKDVQLATVMQLGELLAAVHKLDVAQLRDNVRAATQINNVKCQVSTHLFWRR